MSRIIAAALLLAAALATSYGQISTAAPSRPTLSELNSYEIFFLQVAALKSFDSPAAEQKALDLTDSEIEVLNTIASGYSTETRKATLSRSNLTFEARLQFIEAGETLPELKQRQKTIDDQRHQLIRDHIQKLKAAFGESRFAPVDTFVRSGKSVLAPEAVPPRDIRK